MVKFVLFLIGSIQLFSFTLSGQCPDRDSLWKRLIALKNDVSIPSEQKLQELRKYEEEMEGCPYANDSTHAFLLKQAGVESYHLNDFNGAVRYTRQAIVMIEKYAAQPLVGQYRLLYCYSYYNLQTFYDSLDQIGERNVIIDSCLLLADRYLLIDASIMTALEKKVRYLFYVGDYRRCIRYIDLGEMLTNRHLHGIDSLASAVFCVSWRANVLVFYKKYLLAQDLLLNKVKVCIKASAKEELGFLYAGLAFAYTSSGNYREGVRYLHMAFSLQKETKDYLNCKITLNNLASGYPLHFQNDQEALRDYREAISYTSTKPTERALDALQTVDALNGIAMIYLSKSKYDSSFAYFRLAFDKIRPGLQEMDLLQVPIAEFISNRNSDLVISLLINKGDAYKQRYMDDRDEHDLSEALRIYTITDQFMERLRAEQSEIESFLFWRQASKRMYEHAIEIACLAGKPENALYFFEKSRSVLLNDQLTELHLLHDEDILKLAEIKQTIRDMDRQKDQSERIDSLFASLHEMDRLEQPARQRNNLFTQFDIDTGFARVADLRLALLRDHQALIELFNGDSAVYTLIVTPRLSRVNKIPKKDFDSTVNLYLSYISDPNRQNIHFEAYSRTAYHLYTLIFRDMTIPAGRVIISPDGHYFPFDALVVKDNPGAPVYFMDDHATSYTYSSRYLLNHFPTRPSAIWSNFMGMAPLHYASSPELPVLNGSDASLRRIGAYFNNPQILIGGDASRKNFRQGFTDYKIVQLFSHATDSNSSGEPVIYFADSVLSLSDLIPKDRPVTQLIVLSACETGNGRLYQGEGIFSFNRGFAALGIPSSVTNLWMADNESTYRLTELFYKELAKGLPQDVALQQAKLEFRRTASEEDKLPYYWAATILAGRSDPIEFDKPWLPAIWRFLLAAGVALLFWGAWKYFIIRSGKRPASH